MKNFVVNQNSDIIYESPCITQIYLYADTIHLIEISNM